MYLIAGRRRGPRAKPPLSPSDSPDSSHALTTDYMSDPEDGHALTTDYRSDPDDAPLAAADLDDPELLGELEALRQAMGVTAPAATAGPPGRPGLSVADPPRPPDPGDSAAADDTDDPVLLAELERISGKPKSPVSAAAVVEVDEALLQTLTGRQTELKQAALTAKRQGNMERAREMLVHMKQVQTAAQTVQSGQPLPAGFTIPPRPASEHETPAPTAPAQDSRRRGRLAASTPVAGAATTPTPRAKPARAMTRPDNTTASVHGTACNPGHELTVAVTSTGAAKQQLEAQAADATRLAAYFFKSGNKQKALEFHRLRKQAAADLATVSSYEANGREQPPPLRHREVQWTEPVEQRRDIGANQLQIAVQRVFSDGDLAATFGGRADFYVQWEITWPRDKGTRGYTPALKLKDFDDSAGDLAVDYSRNIDVVDRRNTRPLQRWTERGRMSIELYKYTGLLWGSQLIGRGQLPLAELRTGSEAAGVVEIKAVTDSLTRSGRPLPGGHVFVDVAARLRLPLSNKPEAAVRSERWIYVEDQPRAMPATPQAQSTQHRSTQQHQCEEGAEEKTEEREIEKPPVQQTPAEEPPVEEPTKEPATDADEIATLLDTVDGLVSNAVLEMEQKQIPARIQAAGGDTAQVEHLHDLDAAIQLRMSVIAAQVGAGALSIQEYMDRVASEAAQAKKWALAAKRAGRKDLAVRALQRAKAMKTELDEMSAAMEGGAE
ncbi:hypothetical protein GGF46_005371 [Coemansia sp. RSA 552]|nr:hypothetical protein GGF46_005371 [Coemansia sp. RSA 552]